MEKSIKYLGNSILISSIIIAIAITIHALTRSQVNRYQYLDTGEVSLKRLDTTTELPVLIKQIGDNKFRNPNH